MSRRVYKRRPKKDQILCEAGSTWLMTQHLDVLFKPRWWFIQVQPKILIPSLRKGNRKIIIVDGKRKGWAELRSGLIPLSRYKLMGNGFATQVANLFRRATGLGCKRRERGYAYVKIEHWRFVVLYHFTKDELLVGEAYETLNEDQIGTFIFTEEFSEVHVCCTYEGMRYTMQVLASYIADSMVYSLVADQLNRKIKIVERSGSIANQ